MRYFIEHLKGQHSLKRSLFINFIGGYLASIAVSFGLNEIGVPLVFILAFFLIAIAWGLAGLVCAALNTIWEPTDRSHSRQYRKFQSVFVIFFVVVVIAILLKDLFFIPH